MVNVTSHQFLSVRAKSGPTFSALGVIGEPEGGLLPWLSVPESRLSGGFRHVLVLPTVGHPVSLAEAQTGHSQYVAQKKDSMTEKV